MNLIKLLSGDRACANEYIKNMHTVIHLHIFVYVFLDDLHYHLRLPVIWCVNTLRTLRSNISDTLPLSSSLILSRSLALAFASWFISSSFVKENMSVIIFNKTLGVERFIKDRTRIEQPKLNLVTVDRDSSFPYSFERC